MKKSIRYRCWACGVSAFGTIALLCLAGYGMAPDSGRFEFSALNPLEALSGFVFALGFGLGFPDELAVLTVALGVLSVWWLLFRLFRLLFR